MFHALVSTEQRVEYREQTVDCEPWLCCNKDKESTADFILWNKWCCNYFQNV